MTLLERALRQTLNTFSAFSSLFSRKYEVRVHVLPTSKLPTKKRSQDAGFDFFVDLHDTFPNSRMSYKIIQPGEVVRLSTGCRLQFPKNTMWLWDVRSSCGLKGLDVTCRTIDNEYRGVLSVVLVNNSNHSVCVSHGDRVAQLIPNPFSPRYYVTEVASPDLLKASDRGEKGFGSSGN